MDKNGKNGRSITSAPARADGHAWRARACAVLTGIGTVLEDNPRLDVREVDTPRQPQLVVVDSRLETPLDAHLFIAVRAITIYAAVPNDAKKAALEARGATVVYCPGRQPGTEGKVDLAAMLRDLATREINEVHVEAGHKLNGSLVREGLVDEFLLYLAPKLLGAGRGMVNIGPLAELSQAVELEFRETAMIVRAEGRGGECVDAGQRLSGAALAAQVLRPPVHGNEGLAGSHFRAGLQWHHDAAAFAGHVHQVAFG